MLTAARAPGTDKISVNVSRSDYRALGLELAGDLASVRRWFICLQSVLLHSCYRFPGAGETSISQFCIMAIENQHAIPKDSTHSEALVRYLQ
jgi:hypothetical protein